MSTLWAFREWLLSASQYPPGYEWVELFLGVAYLWAIFRLGLFGTLVGPRRVTGFDATMSALTLIVAVSIYASQL